MTNEKNMTMETISTPRVPQRVSGFDPMKFAREAVNKAGEKVLTLELKHKKDWFRLACPNGGVVLNPLRVTDQMAIFEARLFADTDDRNPLASFTATRSADKATGGQYIRAAQEDALNEALENAGFSLRLHGAIQARQTEVGQKAPADVQKEETPPVAVPQQTAGAPQPTVKPAPSAVETAPKPAAELEQLSKVGLAALTDECISSYYNFQERLAAGGATSLTKALGIDAQELKRLREHNGGIKYLEWLQYEKAIGRDIPDEVIRWFCEKKVRPDDIKFIRDRMSVAQICRYMKRQMADTHYISTGHMLTTWKDCLAMAAQFHMDVNNEIVYRPNNLRQKHDEFVMRTQDKNIALQVGEAMLAHPKVEGILQTLGPKYSYVGKEYLVVVPAGIEEVIREGITLHHCVGSSSRYWDRIEQGESYLLFLRKADAPEKPYYTMEVEPGGTVRQLRTYYDNQNDDIDAARGFLREWQAVVAKRLTEEDRQAAVVSRTLREQEFEQMRRDNVIIFTGNLAGRRMVDVLTADVMEAAA